MNNSVGVGRHLGALLNLVALNEEVFRILKDRRLTSFKKNYIHSYITERISTLILSALYFIKGGERNEIWRSCYNYTDRIC